MRFTLMYILLIVFVLNAFGQNTERIQKDRDGNVIAIFGNQYSADQNVIQKGAENMFFIYSIPDSSASGIEVNQLGFSNRILSIVAGEKGSVFQCFDPKGERNSMEVLQAGSSDSTRSGANEIDIKQKGNGNSVTIIQQ